ncbi:MAG: Gfo/Idh/MocA family oxidoreductase [bacterium]|nr:Gfo/Idh/MocA family oxidoreductase [bacterium]
MKNNVTRRSFLTVPAALGAPAVLAAQSKSDTVRVAFIGTGNRGSYLLRNMLDVPGIQVVAVCDLLQDRADQAAAAVAEKGGKAATYTDYRKMLDRKDIDAVVQAVPDVHHTELNTAILESGRNLYAEKPLALTPNDCRANVAAAKQAKGIMQVGFQLRFDPKRRAGMEFVLSGGIGKVLMCHGIRHGGDLPRHIPWYFDKTKDGDIMVDQGIHILDLFRWAIGDHPQRAMGSGGTDLFIDEPPGRTVMDNYNLILEYPEARVNFSHHYFDPPRFSGIQERVFGTKGSVDLPAGEWQPREKKGPRIKLDLENEDKNSTQQSLAAFIENVRLKRKPPINNVESAMLSTFQVLMGTKAIYEKRIVTWEEIAG